MKSLLISILLFAGMSVHAFAQQDTVRRYAVVMFTKVYITDPAYLSLYAFYEDGSMEKLHEQLKLEYPFSGGTDKQDKAYIPTYPKNVMLILTYMRKRGYELILKDGGAYIFQESKNKPKP